MNTNPFAKKHSPQLTRRAFSKSVIGAGLALAAAPAVLPNILNASTVAATPTASALRDVIAQQLLAFNSQASLVSAAQDSAFHGFLGEQLSGLHPAVAS